MRIDRTTITALMPALLLSSLVRLKMPVSLAGGDVGACRDSLGRDARPMVIRCQERINEAATLVNRGLFGGSRLYP